jgi:hypothetical protein
MWLRSVHLSHTAILCGLAGTSRHFTTPHDAGMAVALTVPRERGDLAAPNCRPSSRSETELFLAMEDEK